MTLQAGTRLGHYVIVGLLGSGGMGEVYRARDPQLGRDAAIKVLPEKFASDPELLARFEQEARLASALNHPNIITIYFIELGGPIRYIAMELVEGKTVGEALAAGPLPIRNVLDVAAQIAAGLAKAHEARIVHRDLKPQNAMIRNDGLVKILDFGLGKLVPPPLGERNPDMPTLGPAEPTLPGRILGTVDYMSPQQAAGDAVDFRSDQFSLGSILYEMVTAKRAFHRATAAQTLSAIIEDEPEPVAAINPEVPFPLQAVIRRCLAKNPDDRYPSTADLATELEELGDNLAEVRAVSWSRFLQRPRPRWQMGLAGLLLAALLVAGIGLLTPSIPVQFPVSVPFQALPAEKQLVVLPFTNVGNDPANQAFCDGLVEILSSKLSQLEQFQKALRVVPTSEVLREGIRSAREARQTFGVTLAITGSVQRTEDRVRLTVNLVDPQTLRQLKAKTIDAEARDISVLQDGVVLEVANLLEIDLPEAAKRLLTAGGTTIPGAYEFYLQGRGYLQRYDRLENVENAVGLFRRALERDPSYASSHAGLGEAYWRKYELTKDSHWVELARGSSATSLALNDTLAPVYVTLGMIDTRTGRYEDAIRNFERALQIDRVNADAYRELASVYEGQGKLPEAEATYQRAIGIRPTDWASYSNLGRFYYRLARYAEAATQARRVAELTPDNTRAYGNLSAALLALKQYDEAITALERSVAIKPNELAYMNLAVVYFMKGRYADAARTNERALKINDRDYRIWRNLGTAYYWAPNEREKAVAAFQRAAQLAEQDRQMNPRNPRVLVHLADCYSRLGEPDHARDLLRQALRLAPQEVAVMFNIGAVYEQLGDRERALEWVRNALQHGYASDLIESYPDLAQLRADPRFQGLRSP